MARPRDFSQWFTAGDAGHSVQLYEDDAELLDGLAHFIGRAAQDRAPSIVIATDEHRQGLLSRLSQDGAFAEAQEAGRVQVLDASETLSTFMLHGRPDRQQFMDVIGGEIAHASKIASSGGGYIAAYGEMVGLLWADGRRTASIELEQLWNELAETYSFNLHCAYPSALFAETDDASSINDICEKHSAVVGYTCVYCDAFVMTLAGWRQHSAVRHPNRPLGGAPLARVTQRQPDAFAVALQFGHSEQVVTAIMERGAPVQVRLPGPITWPDGSRSEFVEIVIEQMGTRPGEGASA